MHSISSSSDHKGSSGLLLRQDFIDNLTAHRYRFFLQKSDIVLTEIFISIYDMYHHDEFEFTNSVLFTLFEILPNNTEARTIGQNALDFYEENKFVLSTKTKQIDTSETESKTESKPKLESDSSNISIEANLLYPDIFAQLVIASSCHVNYEPLTTAVTLSCGHSLNQISAEIIYGKLNDEGKCETKKTCYCSAIPTSYCANKVIREAALKIEEISKTLIPNNDLVWLTSHQTDLIKNLLEVLTCSFTFKPISSAVILYESDDNTLANRCNDPNEITKLTPDYTLRELAILAPKISSLTSVTDLKNSNEVTDLDSPLREFASFEEQISTLSSENGLRPSDCLNFS
ncbi:MAG: hypothetical protein H0W50_01280 [Parachlamydiaceae bacterium]|nr:hypothetical protein [Parachlamydiaceae bacterium]